MFFSKNTPIEQDTQVVITDAYAGIGQDIFYRDENGVVFPGVRVGKIEAAEYRNDPRYPIGWYFQVRDSQFPKHAPKVWQGSLRGFVNPNIMDVAV